MYCPRFSIGQFNGRFDRALSDRAMLHLLELLISINIDYLRANPDLPPLYETTIYYDRVIPVGREDDDWADIPTCITNGYADCEDAACWRIAELRLWGFHAEPILIREDYDDGGWLYHIRVKGPNGEEDPSEVIDHKGNFRRGRTRRL